jgi:carboxylesterase type B
MFALLGLSIFLHAIAAVDAAGLTVDLGYGIYTGVFNSSSRLNVWKGIRYAAPPVGPLRWQAPRPPPGANRTAILSNTFGPACPQALSAKPGASAIFIPGNEDCLFLNVYAPASSGNASEPGFPVLVAIHGGGYGLGDASQDMAGFINTNNNSLVAVTIQYRVCDLAWGV